MPETASERKDRLKKIQEKARSSKKDIEEKNEVTETEGPPVKRLKFRNYAPHDVNLATKNDSAIKNTLSPSFRTSILST